MSKKNAVSLHLEWTPGWVRAVNVTTGESAEGVTLKKLGQVVIGHKEVLVGIGRKNVFVKTVRLPKALPEDLRRIVAVQLGQFFPLPADQLSFDFIQTANQTHDGYLTIIAAVRADDLRLLFSELKEVGLTAARVLPIALASLVIAAKAGHVDALIASRSRGDIAFDVVVGSFLRSSRVAVAAGDFETEAKRTIAAANAGDVPIIDLAETDNTHIKLLDQTPSFDFKLAESRALLIKQQIAARNRAAFLVTVVALAIVSLVWADRQQDMTAMQEARARAAAQVSNKQAVLSVATATAQHLSGLQVALSHAFSPGQQLSDISAFVSDSLPAGAWLTGLTVERAKEVQVRGTATTPDKVATFVDHLGSSPRFANVKLVFANSALVGTTPVIQFNVTADCVGNVPMPEPSKDGSAVETASAGGAADGAEGGG